jgi:hypothetical protein
MRRWRHVILILNRRIRYQFSTEKMEFEIALENFNNAVSALSSAADALIQKAGTDASALAQANTELAAVDSQATAAVQAQTDKINAALNPPQ